MYGFFKNKRIVLYDTLVEQCQEEEVTAVLAHELGESPLSQTWLTKTGWVVPCCAVLCWGGLGWAVLCCVGLGIVTFVVIPLHVILLLFCATLCCAVLTLALLSSARLAAIIQRTQG